jgi:soluble lytic murein transglycosylase-like protein
MISKIKWLTAILLLFLPIAKSNAYQSCVEEASKTYGINPVIIYAIIKTESGFNPRAVNKNRNGTYDIGLMQVNTSWLPTLSKYGYNINHLFDPCVNVHVGTWVLANCIKTYGYNWKAIDCYNKGSKATGRGAYVWSVYKHMLNIVYGSQIKPNIVKTNYRIERKKNNLVVAEKDDGKLKHIQINYNDDNYDDNN